MSKQQPTPDCDICTHLRAAALSIIGSDGIEHVTIERLAAEACMPERLVLEHYEDASDCLYATYEEVSEGIYEDFARCFAFEPGWRRALMLAARTLLARLAAAPAEARLCFVDILRSDHELLRRRNLSRRRLVDLFVRELGRRRDDPEQFRVQLELLIGAGFQAIAAAVESGDVQGLPGIEPELESRAFVFEPVAA